MRKFWKIFGVSLGSLAGVLLAAVAVVMWIVLTPNKLTSIVRTQAAKFLTCESRIDRVEATFFSTFPKFGLRVDNMLLINRMAGAPSDTLLRVGEVGGSFDIMAFLRHDRIEISDLRLIDGRVCIFTDSAGRANYDIFGPSDTTSVPADTSALSLYANLNYLALKNIDVSYVDRQSDMGVELRSLSGRVDGAMKGEAIDVAVTIKPFDLAFLTGSGDEALKADIKGLAARVTAAMAGDTARVGLEAADPFSLSLSMGKDEYLHEATARLRTQAWADLAAGSYRIDSLALTLNELPLGLKGTVAMPTEGAIVADLAYTINEWPVERLLAMVPAAYASYTEGLTATGLLSSHGTVIGPYDEEHMPVVNVGLLLKNGRVRYHGLPFTLHDVNGDVEVCADLQNESISYVKVNRLAVRMPHSSFRVAGTVDRLYTDPRTDLTTDFDIDLSELNPMIPNDLNTTLKGSLVGRVRSNVSMSQIDKMDVEKMRLSGRLTFKELDVQYDTLSLRSARSVVELAMPNPKPATPATKFLFARLLSDDLHAETNGMTAMLADAAIDLAVSDVRDTVRMPSMIANFKIDRLYAAMDTINVAIAGPAGTVSVAPQRNNQEQPRLSLKYNCSNLLAMLGNDKVEAHNAFVNSDILYNSNETEFVKQIIPRGSFGLENGHIAMSSLQYPIEIPAMKVAFSPQEFNIDRARVKIDRSDFSLSGRLTNLYRYIRGDSLLKGDFSFTSDSTDVSQLMSLTSGIGDASASTNKQSAPTASTEPAPAPTTASDTWPFMVPKGVDVTLHANVRHGMYGPTVISNINGDVRVRDGVLALDKLTLSTPGADMQMTALYESPRKNHLFAGIDFHLTNVEIDQMIRMIPDLDELMPMLRSFSGKAAFHMAIDTNLDSMYNVKMSTLHGSASIDGKDLVLMDGETFTEIAKMLMFKKNTRNKVDSLAAVFTVYRNEIDVYPLLVAMDRYKAVVAGRHNTDMTFDYNISLVETPLHLPFNVAVDVSGSIDKLKYSLARSKYPEFYRPAWRREVENKQLEIKQMIHNALTRGVVKKQ
ncbi:MAG: hypothetical protein LBH06_05745 [Rikenellaceae bacterium]|jgi:hypothetical protein|nr:hypothetical protein [Rikenellaceae bacterium]